MTRYEQRPRRNADGVTVHRIQSAKAGFAGPSYDRRRPAVSQGRRCHERYAVAGVVAVRRSRYVAAVLAVWLLCGVWLLAATHAGDNSHAQYVYRMEVLDDGR